MIDLHHYMLAIGVGNLAIAVLMLAYAGSSSAIPGWRIWMWARMVFGATQLLGGLRPQLGLSFLALVESAGWMAGLALETSAYAAFFGAPRARRYLLPIAGLLLLLACASPLSDLPYEEVVACVALLIGTGALLVGVLLAHPRLPDASPLRRVIGLVDIASAAALLQFGVFGIGAAGVPEWSLMLAYLAGYMLLIVNGFGFVLMSKQRDDARMAHLATTDGLTALLNRRAFFDRAEAARLLALRQQQPITLLMLDIDHFKQLNDRFGHATGDEALVQFATACNEALREHDILGRLGGEEFALALPGTDLDGALHAAERLRQAVPALRLLTCGNSYTLTVSIGVVLVEPQEDLAAALARADHALYQAKRNGRNRVEAGQAARRRA